MDRRAVALGIAGSAVVLVYLVARGPAWDSVAVVLAALLPAGLVLYGGAARGRSSALRTANQQTERAYRRSEDANQDLKERVAELMTLNELAAAAGSTLDRDELLDGSLHAVVRHLRFDRALILLADDAHSMLSGGRSVGGSPDMTAAVAELELPLDQTVSQLVQLYHAEGPLLFRDLDEDPDDGNRAFAAMMEGTSFLGTPLVSKGRTVGILAVDNRASGRDVGPGDGPLLYTVGSLIAAAIENARLYEEVESQKEALERRVVERTAALAAAIEEAQAARVAAEAASASKTAFLSNVSHELRTPLTSVVGFSKLIRRRLDEAIFPSVPAGDPNRDRAMRQVSDNLGIIVEEGERLTALINDTLDLAKIEAGRMEWRRDVVDLADVIVRATAATAPLVTGAGPQVVLHLAPDLPPITGDRDRLIQVVINLISNAVKFTASGTITCSARLEEGEAAIVVSVADTGVGIAPEDQAKVFEQFGQAGDTLTDKPRGTGLGLPICREIVEHHGGRLWLESEVGHGSTFSFSLPLGGGPAPEALSAAPEALSAAAPGAATAAADAAAAPAPRSALEPSALEPSALEPTAAGPSPTPNPDGSN
ncbi:MAG: ATP-binding protein [Candidatus Limnocylindrales bacterium]